MKIPFVCGIPQANIPFVCGIPQAINNKLITKQENTAFVNILLKGDGLRFEARPCSL